MRYGEMEAAAFGDLLDTLPREEVIENVITGLNLAYLRGAADVFASIGKEADNKVEVILSKDPDDSDEIGRSTSAGALLAYEAMQKECARQYDEVMSEGFGIILSRVGASEGLSARESASLAALGSADAMDEAPRVNAQVEGATAPQFEGFSPDETVLNIAGPEAAR